MGTSCVVIDVTTTIGAENKVFNQILFDCLGCSWIKNYKTQEDTQT